MLIHEKLNEVGTVCLIDIPRNAMFLGNNNQKFYRNQIFTEIKTELDLLLEKSRTDFSSEFPVEVFFQNLCLEKTTNTKEAKNQILKKII